MAGQALKPNKAFNSLANTGVSHFAARYDDPRIVASGLTPQATAGAIKPTVNMTAITAHTAATAVGAVFADLAAARDAVNTLRTDAETALGAHDTALTALRSEAEARLDAIETKVDLIISKLTTAGMFT